MTRRAVTRVVLASASAGRLGVLRNAGIDPLVVVSAVDEDAILVRSDGAADPAIVVTALATAKADDVAGRLDDGVRQDCVVIGCDSMLYVDGRLRGKPASTEDALRQWESMAGRSGQLYTGHCVLRLRTGEVVHRAAEAAVTTVRFGTPTRVELAAYLDSGEPLKVAGGFTIDGLGGWFVDGVDGDPSNVVGLGLALTRRMLAAAGLSVADLWADRDQR